MDTSWAMLATSHFQRALRLAVERRGARELARCAGLSQDEVTAALDPGARPGLDAQAALAAAAGHRYEDFLALWKDADPDIPILKQARQEYAKLK